MELNQLELLLEEDLAWRKKEISTLILTAKTTPNEVLLKSAILLLYAHWEGYIKNSSRLYLKYVSESKNFINDLTVNFKAVALKGIIQRCLATSDKLTLQNELAVMQKFSEVDTMRFRVSTGTDKQDSAEVLDSENRFDDGVINTHSNLNTKVFKNILSILGLKYKNQFDPKAIYIERHLLGNRNIIGHGNKFKNDDESEFNLEINDIEKLRDIIFLIIDNFQEEILEYSKEEYYLSCNNEKLEEYLFNKEVELEAAFKIIDTKYE